MEIYSEKLREIARDERTHKKKVRVKILGRKSLFPAKVRNAIKRAGAGNKRLRQVPVHHRHR